MRNIFVTKIRFILSSSNW